MARKIVIASGKGGVGKTTLTVRLGCYLASRGARVLVCDGDFGLNNVDLLLGVEGKATCDLVDVIEGRCRAKQALVRCKQSPNLWLLSSNRSEPERFVSAQSLKIVLDALAPQFDFLLVDAPSGLSEGFHRAVSVSDEAIVVTTPEITAIRDADKTVSALKNYRLKRVELVVNRVRGEKLAKGEGITPKQIGELLRTPVVGVVPELCGLGELSTPPHRSISVLGKNLLTGEKKVYDAAKKYRGVFGGLRRLIKEFW